MIDLKNPAWDFGDEYAFWEDTEYVTPQIEHNIRPHGNQGDNPETRSACTIVWATNQLIRLFWIDLNREKTNILYKEVIKYCQKYWYVVWSGRSTPTAVNVVCKWWNEIWYKTFNKEQVFWLRLYWNHQKILEALDKGHLVWFTKELNFSSDQVEGLVHHDVSLYPKSIGHRLNWAWVDYITATGWADISKAERWAEDNYHGQIWEFFAFQEVKPFINHWIYAYWYVIMPVSCKKESVEEQKKRIANEKAINAIIWILSSTYWDIDDDFQLMSSAYAWAIRDRYNNRPLIENQEKKVYQAVIDLLSYAWKFAGEEEKEKYSELASYLRNKFWLK